MITEIKIPNIGIDEVEITEILVNIGDNIQINQSIIIVEGNKTSIEIPSPESGIVLTIPVKIGDIVKTNSIIMELETKDSEHYISKIANHEKEKKSSIKNIDSSKNIVYIRTSPYVRKIAREYGIDLEHIKYIGSGNKGRILSEDIYRYIKDNKLNIKNINHNLIKEKKLSTDFERHLNVVYNTFGRVEEINLNHIQKISGKNLHKNWINIPHVTQFEEVDITELELFRNRYNNQIQDNKKLTLLPFIIKIVYKALEKFPYFNSSLSEDKEKLILKKYFNIGIAINTKDGLLVPVIREVNKKSILDLSYELKQIIKKSKYGNLQLSDMQGGCFTISNLGSVGGSTFTPIINAPEVAILGISRTLIKPLWNGKEFVPKTILPLSLSYDHRVINGVDGVMFIKTIEKFISDVRFLIL